MEAPRSGSAVRPCQPEKHTAAVGRSCCISRRDAARRYVTNVAQNGKLGYRTTLPHDRQAHCARVSLHTSPRTHSHDPAPHPAKSTPRASSFRIGRKLPSETVKRRSANPPPRACERVPPSARVCRSRPSSRLSLTEPRSKPIRTSGIERELEIGAVCCSKLHIAERAFVELFNGGGGMCNGKTSACV